MTQEQRIEALNYRQQKRISWHGPPHQEHQSELYLITAACYEHKPIIGSSPDRMAAFETELLTNIQLTCPQVFAWVLLPNHYHILMYSPSIRESLAVLGKMHGRTSYRWNIEEKTQGRKVWHGIAETGMKSDGHFWASLNYVLHNAVRHGYAERWQDWPYSNAADYLANVGRDEVERRWREYPIFNYGDSWDAPEL